MSKKKDASFDLMKHVLVPVHKIVDQDEREELLSKYGIKPYQLPRILSTDPVVKAIGARPGDIIKIERISPTAGKSVFYRYVVEEK
ncbi:DNA-directed RNA polymerase subunit H [Candidatus Bathyarchaeota archaeon ex4484_205]|nr:MAG: DNA-directed RNA polymerase subunit H [Candidatus Bathyarchaeota archaeon ex4484_205]RLG68161.1 MAG: DNA-directed RNA polymerase subunit H [archaeon]